MYTRPVAQRKNESGENLVNVGLKVSKAARDLLEDIGIEHDRPQGYVARKLVLRGIAAYKRDHSLDEPLLSHDPAPGTADHRPHALTMSIPGTRPSRNREPSADQQRDIDAAIAHAEQETKPKKK